MNDKVLILEDTNEDGRADKCTVFADGLHVPTGLEFYNRGVLVGAQPDLLWLRDTDGDDRADQQTRALHGLDSADTHHALNSLGSVNPRMAFVIASHQYQARDIVSGASSLPITSCRKP